MRRCGLRLRAGVSLWLLGCALAGTRPHYGGTLRAAVQAAPMSLDPADPRGVDGLGHGLSHLLFDTLVMLDESGRPQPGLAVSWQAQPGNQRWQFAIRPGASFEDGKPITAEAVAASLRAANANWKVFPAGETVVIENSTAAPALPAALALAHYGIARRDGGKVTGSGAFAVSRWEAGKKLILTARDDYWDGRPFLDTIEIELGRSYREQMLALDLGQADLVEIAPEQARRAGLEGRRVEYSAPAECLALVFSRDLAGEAKLREAVSLSIDREAMKNVLLQGNGEPAGALLPEWLSGYAFLFSPTPDLTRARQLAGEGGTPAWSLAYDAADSLARILAERVALNARDAGLTLQPTAAASGDIRLMRLAPRSLDPRVALGELALSLGLEEPRFQDDMVGSLYASESVLLRSHQVIPLLHLRTSAAIGPSVRNWHESRNGNWRLEDVWVRNEKP